MQLLQELRDLSHLQPLKEYLNCVEELGFDPNSKEIYPQIVDIIKKIEKNESLLTENPMARRMASKSGVNLNNAQQKIHRMGIDSPRLGLQAHDPEMGDRVLMAGGGGIGQVVRFSGDTVAVKNKNGYVIELPRSSLVAKIIPNPQNPDAKHEIGWIEQG